MPRAKLNPTQEERDAVRGFSARGFTHEDICFFLNIRSPKTLRKYFRHELTTARPALAVEMYKRNFDLAMDGKHPEHSMLWLRKYGQWGPNMIFEVPSERQSSTCIFYLHDSKAPPYTAEELAAIEPKALPEIDDPFEAPPEPEPEPVRKLV